MAGVARFARFAAPLMIGGVQLAIFVAIAGGELALGFQAGLFSGDEAVGVGVDPSKVHAVTAMRAVALNAHFALDAAVLR
jgi:hypothetical protein